MGKFPADLIEHAAQPFVIGYPDGRIGFCNRAYEQLTGYSADELSSLNWSSTLTPDEWRGVEHEKLEELDRTREPVRYEKEYLRKDGSRVPIELLVHLAADAGGKLLYYYAFVTDISGRKHLEDGLRRSYDELERRVTERTMELQRVNAELLEQMEERRHADDAVRQARDYNRKLIETNLDPMVTINADGKITDANIAATKLTGYAHDELLGTDFSDYFTDPDKARAVYTEVFARESVRDYALEIRHRHGFITPVLYNAALFHDDKGIVLGVFAAARDITEQRRAEEMIVRLNRLYAVLSKVNEAIVRIHTPEELYERVCRIAVEEGAFVMAWVGLADPVTKMIEPVVNYGDSRGYLKGVRIYAADVPEGRGPTGKAVLKGRYSISSDIENDPDMLPWRDKAVSHGFRSSAAFPFRAGPGSTGVLTVYSDTPRFFAEEEIYLIASLAEDVSFALDVMANDKRRLEAEDELRKLNEELEQRVAARTSALEAANKELESFSYSVSHDLQAPLRHISGFTELLQKNLGEGHDKKIVHYASVISEAAKKMSALIHDLLKFSQIGRADMRRNTVELNALVKEVVAEIMEHEKGRRIKWKVIEMPDVMADPSLLRLVFVNLISNAVKFSRSRKVAEIDISCEERFDEYVFHVGDNGVGFDMKYADKLFGVFQRLHHSDEFEGTGIGLANVRRIIARHGGRTWAESEPGEGALFYFSLPRDRTI